uniref:Uncharacterized protein n=1 Tax=Phakopsora pachyrhizi TaxID=170000 RepID=A0A0S1MJ70_PHAPC
MSIFSPLATAYFFISIGLLERRSLDEIKQTIRRNHFHVTAVNMMVFGPAQIINMSSIPLYARPPFLNCVALGYNCFLATINRKDKMTSKDNELIN